MSDGIMELNADLEGTEVDWDEEASECVEKDGNDKKSGIQKPKTRIQKRYKRKRLSEEQITIPILSASTATLSPLHAA